MLLGALVPMILLLMPYTRKHPFWRMIALGLVAIGVVAYRWDTNLAGLLVVVSYMPGETAIQYASYFPSLIEAISGLGIVAYGVLAFSFGVRYLRVVDHRLMAEEAETVRVEAAQTLPV
jgi:Ni/Fe-hydrogenase subunit HybB-like protein